MWSGLLEEIESQEALGMKFRKLLTKAQIPRGSDHGLNSCLAIPSQRCGGACGGWLAGQAVAG